MENIEELFAAAFRDAPHESKHNLAKAMNKCLKCLYPSVIFPKIDDDKQSAKIEGSE